MIFVTVGQALPFDRLIRAVDEWAGARQRGDVFAQTGKGHYAPVHINWVRTLKPHEFNAHARKAAAIVAHAGMGTIITALEFGCPLVVMPRRAALREHTNDHQLATARYWAKDGRIAVAFDEAELTRILDNLGDLQPPSSAPSPEADRLHAVIRNFLAQR